MSDVNPKIKGKAGRTLVSAAGSALSKSGQLKSEAASVLSAASSIVKHTTRKAPEHKGKTTADKITHAAQKAQASKIVHVKEEADPFGDKEFEEKLKAVKPRMARGAKPVKESNNNPVLATVEPVASTTVVTPPNELPKPELTSDKAVYESLTPATAVPSQVVAPAGLVHDVTVAEIAADEPKTVPAPKVGKITRVEHKETIAAARAAAKEKKQHEDWSKTKHYVKGDLVHWKGDIFVALTPSHGAPPTMGWHRVRKAHSAPRVKKEKVEKAPTEKKKRVISPENKAKMQAAAAASRAAKKAAKAEQK
jgi:hypothetical protein